MVFTYTEDSAEDFASGTLSGTISRGTSLTLASEEIYTYGILTGMYESDLGFIPNWFNGVSNVGEFTPTGSYFIDGLYNYRDIGDINQGVVLQEGVGVAGITGYVLYTVESTQSRFGLGANYSAHFVGVRYNSGDWYYDNNSSFVLFVPSETDVLVAELGWGVSYITPISCVATYGERLNTIEVTVSGGVIGVSQVGFEESGGAYLPDNTYISLPIQTSFNNSVYTIEAWCRLFVSGVSIFARGASGESVATNIIRLVVNTSNVWVWYERGSGADYEYTIPISVNIIDGELHHICFVFNLALLTVYIDGVYQNQQSMLPTDSKAPIYINSYGSASHAHAIMFREYRIWSLARTYSAIMSTISGTVSSDSPGLLCYYKFDEYTGATVYDHSDNSNNATIVGSVVWSEVSCYGRYSADGVSGWSEWEEVDKNSVTTLSGVYGLESFFFNYKQVLNSPSIDAFVMSNYKPSLDYFSLYSYPTYKFSGIALENGVEVNASGVQVVLHKRDGTYVSSCYTTSSGTFILYSPYYDYHYIVALHQEPEKYNALICDWLHPEEL